MDRPALAFAFAAGPPPCGDAPCQNSPASLDIPQRRNPIQTGIITRPIFTIRIATCDRNRSLGRDSSPWDNSIPLPNDMQFSPPMELTMQ